MRTTYVSDVANEDGLSANALTQAIRQADGFESVRAVTPHGTYTFKIVRAVTRAGNSVTLTLAEVED